MRGDVVFRIYGVHRGRAEDSFFGARRTRAEAAAVIAELSARQMHGKSWAGTYHDQGFVIREALVDTDFEIPPLPKPRDAWVLRATPLSNGNTSWPSTRVAVFRRGAETPVASYERNHGLYTTFEPFRQGARELALISRDYERTAVLDLASGQIIAEETDEKAGFCPIGFYVPDWWDVNDGSIIPGSEYWRADREWPTGQFGFVWGCVWGDDTSWKLQHLDLSRVTDGVIARDERYGYLPMADLDWDPPWLDLAPTTPSEPPPFLKVWMTRGVAQLSVVTETTFELVSGDRLPDEG
jgi:hypothetical protein